MQSTNVTASFCATVVDEWCRLGVRHAVVAPGSRSTPMVVALASAPDITLHVFHDERSAAFAALGISTVTRLATLLLCTSGTAAANFYPAIIEASHSEVPLLVMTADRPPELQGVGAAQTIDQRNLYGNAVRLFIDAGVPDDDAFETEFRKKHPYPFATLDTVLDHIDHVVKLVGIDYVGIGSDYDGVGDSLPVGLKDVASYPNLIDGLLKRGYSEADIEKILSGNLLRVWRTVEQYAAQYKAG